jgi:tetratricopeptide (TPR) repeat protein
MFQRYNLGGGASPLPNRAKISRADVQYLGALAGYEKALGPDHTSTLSTVDSLGILYRAQGKLEEAEKMYTRALAGYEKVLAPDHPSTIRTKRNIENLRSL